MTYFIFLITLFTWPFGQLLSFNLFGFPFSTYLLDILVFLLFLSELRPKLLCKYFQDPIIKAYSVFILLSLVSFILNLNHAQDSGLLLSFFYLFRLIIYPSLYIAAKEIGNNKLKTSLFISLSIFVTLSLGQYLLLPDMRFLKNLGFDDHYYRLIGPFYDPNFAGAIFASLALIFVGNKKYLVSILMTVLLALTFSRASYLCFILGLLIILVLHKKTKLLLILAILGFSIFLAPKPFGEGVNLWRTYSIQSRIDSWQNGLSLFAQRPILGWGYNTLRNSVGGRLSTDNTFILLLATTGILGFVTFFLFLKTVFLQQKNSPTLAVIITIIFHSFFNNSLFFIWIFAFFWVYLGLLDKD